MADFDRVKWAISHDPCKVDDRVPYGAVSVGSTVHLTLRVDGHARSLVSSASILVGERIGALEITWVESTLDANDVGFAGSCTLEAVPHVAFYAFKLDLTDGTTAYYVPCANGRSTAGELVRPGLDGKWTQRGWVFSKQRLAERPTGGFGLAGVLPGFQITVYEPSFATPSWMRGAILYQIFPDRFARGPHGVNAEGLRYHEKMGRLVQLHKSWNEPVEWQDGNAEKPTFDPVDFYGGSFDGIRRKLPYLASLGVEVLYLNPVFEARSNHRYDTADYEHVDPLLGTEEDFEALAKEAGEYGIHVILDAVLSHTGNDSRYFNALETYDEPGAAQGEQSPYYRWFDFGCANDKVPYRCWWGDPTLPEVDERDDSWQHYILGEGGILQRWLSAGAGGYRLDVADEIPDDVLERLRTCVKHANPDAAIIGEVWEDATTKESYGSPRTYALGLALDSVMNYPLRSALLGFALEEIDAHQLATFLRQQQANYPSQLHACLMNLLSSHDVERMRSVLALRRSLKGYTRAKQLRLVSRISSKQDREAARLQRMTAALLYALPGMPSIYYGDECGLQGGGDPFCRATFPWSEEGSLLRTDRGEDLTQLYRELGRVRKESTALRKGAFACSAPHENVVCTISVDASSGIVVTATNRSDVSRTVAFDTNSPGLGLPSDCCWDTRRFGRARQIFCSEECDGEAPIACDDGIVRVTVPAYATVYWKAARRNA